MDFSNADKAEQSSNAPSSAACLHACIMQSQCVSTSILQVIKVQRSKLARSVVRRNGSICVCECAVHVSSGCCVPGCQPGLLRRHPLMPP
jgi:hypothetical protein